MRCKHTNHKNVECPLEHQCPRDEGHPTGEKPCNAWFDAPNQPISAWKCDCGREMEYYRGMGGPYGEIQCECGWWWSITGAALRGPAQDMDPADCGERLDDDY